MKYDTVVLSVAAVYNVFLINRWGSLPLALE